MGLGRIIHKYIISSLLLLLIPASSVAASVSSIYYDCVYAWDFGETDRKSVVVRPVGNICYTRCQKECQMFSRGTTGGDNSLPKDPNQYGADSEAQDELNSDIIEQCRSVCQRGLPFTSQYREVNPDAKSSERFIMKPAVTTKTYCSTNITSIDSADYAFSASGITVDPTSGESTQQVSIGLVNPEAIDGNTVYLCGFKKVKMFPAFRAYSQTMWQNSSNKWPPGYKPQNWHARNPYWVDTGIDIKDGDRLTIKYSGNFFSGAHVNNNSFNNPSDYIMYVRKPVSNEQWIGGNASPLPGDKLQLMNVNTSTSPEGEQEASYGQDPGQVIESNQKQIWHGLTPQVWAETRNLMADSNVSPLLLNAIRDSHNQNLERYRSHLFSGFLEGFSKEYTRLGLMHYFVGNPSSNRTAALGGFEVEVTWRGCPFKDGQRLQYAVVPPEPIDESLYRPYSSDIDWYEVPEEVLKGEKKLMPQGKKKGQLYFRINKLPDDYTQSSGLTPQCLFSDSICQDSLESVEKDKYARFNTTGQYFLTVEKEKSNAPITGTISGIVQTIKGYFFGDNKSQGAVPKIFNHLVTDTPFVQAIRLLLVLYITYTGFSFMVGISQITQQEAVIRILKIGVIVLLISPDSWNFFFNHLFKLFSDGSIELIAKINAPIYAGSYNEQTIIDNPELIFSIFDRPFQQLFSQQVWVKIVAVMFSNLLGFLIAIVVVFAVVMYAFCIAKALMIYLVSLIGMAILFLIAPIFICFILFKYTRTMFDSWIKLMLSFAMQPVFVFTAIGVLNNLLLVCLYTTLSFTACKMCFLGFHLPPLVDLCIIPGYITLGAAHHPPSDSLGSPVGAVAAALCFLIIGQAMYAFCGFCSSLANTIATGSFVGVDLENFAAAANPISNIASIIGEATGLDGEARRRRQDIKDMLPSFGYKDAKGKTGAAGLAQAGGDQGGSGMVSSGGSGGISNISIDNRPSSQVYKEDVDYSLDVGDQPEDNNVSRSGLFIDEAEHHQAADSGPLGESWSLEESVYIPDDSSSSASSVSDSRDSSSSSSADSPVSSSDSKVSSEKPKSASQSKVSDDKYKYDPKKIKDMGTQRRDS